MSGNDHKYYNKCIQQLVVEYGEYLCNCTRYSSSLFSKPFWPYEICHHVFLGNNVMYVIPKQHFLFLDITSFAWCFSLEKGILRNMLLIVIPTYKTGNAISTIMVICEVNKNHAILCLVLNIIQYKPKSVLGQCLIRQIYIGIKVCILYQ